MSQVGEPPRMRPTVVTVAGWLLFVAGAVQLISVVVLVSQVGTIYDVYQDAYRGTEIEDGAAAGAVGGLVAVAVLFGLLGIAYLILATFNNRGKNPARITTWVLGGIGACCGTVLLVGNAVGNSFNFRSEGRDLPDPEDVQRQVTQALPSWYSAATITLGLVALLALLTVIILLALPPANEFFRKPQPVWQPPAYPQAGGYPQPGAYPTPGTPYPPPAAPPAPGIPPPPAGAQPPPGAPPSGWQPPPGGPPPPSGPPA